MRDPVERALGLATRKVIAVHVNFASRAAQRGRIPEFPSYFLKAPSSLVATGSQVVRPEGTELLGFEGEIALVIGTAAREVPYEQAWRHVGWVTAANDLGLHDLRYADRGSNLRAKSGDGFTPIGPTFLDAQAIDPGALRLRTWVNGELVQVDTSDTLLFGFAELVADLSRLSTLEPGDVVLTGTPAGAGVIEPGDTVEVEVDDPATGRGTGRLRTSVVAGPALAPYGATPRVDDGLRAEARGVPASDGPPAMGEQLRQRLLSVGVVTLSAQLRQRGLHDVHLEGVHSARPGAHFAGTARTLRYVPVREDLFATYGGGLPEQKRAIESLAPGEVLVVETRGESGSGAIGTVLALRAQVRGAAAIVTDGAIRGAFRGSERLEIPVFHGAAHPAVLNRRHIPWERDVAVGCGGTTVCPGDIVVGDDDGVIVIPSHLAEEVAADALEQENQERFITEQLLAGTSLDGLYPLGARWHAAYQRWQETHAPGS